MINKHNFIKLMAKNGDLTQKETKYFMEVFIDTLADLLDNGETVKLIGLGKFQIREAKEKIGKNPNTLEPLVIPAHKKVKFTASKLLEDKCCR